MVRFHGDQEGATDPMKVSAVVVQVLGDYALCDLMEKNQSLVETNRALRRHIRQQNNMVAEVLQVTANTTGHRVDVPPEFDNCQFCYYPTPRGSGGGICPCGAVGYCSTECHRLDWTRHHRTVCAWRRGQAGNGPLLAREEAGQEGEDAMEEVD